MDKQQAKDAVKVSIILAQAIREAGTIKSGTLYALSMGAFQNVEAYESCINLLVRAGLVRRGQQHDLIWCGEDQLVVIEPLKDPLK